MDILSLYVNCSLGGMATVYRNRIAAAGDRERHSLIFTDDAGGLDSFLALPDTDVRIIRRERLAGYLRHFVVGDRFAEVRITAMPHLPGLLAGNRFAGRLIYEFHDAVESHVVKELRELDLDAVHEIWTPSDHQRGVVVRSVAPRYHAKVRAVANLLDTKALERPHGPQIPYHFGGRIPLSWIGRFDPEKNGKEFLRILSRLPDRFVGICVASREGDPARADDFLSEAFTFGVEDRIRVFLNLQPAQMADLYASIRRDGGICCSTSLGESYGYVVAEALAVGLDVVAYDVGSLFELGGGALHLVEVGDTATFAATVLRIAGRSPQS